MCGIAGAVNFEFSEEAIKCSMGHRGPDEHGSYSFHNVQFFHLRLSILDIECGQQPMHLRNQFTIVYNGQVYNHLALRSQFNLQCRTNSDTETLLLLYEKLGAKMLHYLDGMFAFAIHDKVKNILFIARDREGSKPLYYYLNEKQFVFASELNGLRSILPLEIDRDHFHSFLRFGSFFRTHTPYKNVSELVQGSYLTIDCGSGKIHNEKWWDIHLPYKTAVSDTFDYAIEKTRDLLTESVKRRLESSDLEVGAFLSGGIDSGLVTAIGSKVKPGLKTFTVSFSGAYDEAPLAKLVADRYKTDHTEIFISFDHLQQDVEKILANYGEPFFDSSAIPSYYVSKAAKQFVSVVLNGDGADELFGGYRRYVPFAKFDFFKERLLIKAASRFITSIFPASDDKKSVFNYAYRLADFSSKSGLDIYLSAGVDIFEGYTDYFSHVPGNYMDDADKLFDRITTSEMSALKKLMNLDFDINLPGDLLVKMDIATMANSLEGRSPFLSKDLLEYIPSLPDDFKIKGRTTKHMLRVLAMSYLPGELIHQPKRGFEIPLKQWVNFQLKDIIHSYLTCPGALHRDFLQPEFVSSLLERKIKISEEKRAKIIWTIFAMEVWHQKVHKG